MFAPKFISARSFYATALHIGAAVRMLGCKNDIDCLSAVNVELLSRCAGHRKLEFCKEWISTIVNANQ